MLRSFLIGCVLLLAWPVFAATPLTDPQKEQLSTATDDSPLYDEAALYPLLENAIWWDDDLAGATIPDYAGILAAPAEHRGELFLIEGEFAGVPKPGWEKVEGLSRPGPWDQRLQRWGVVVREDPDEVALVLLVDPPAKLPHAGAKVRLAARFYKVWADRDMRGSPTRYAVFVGKTALVGKAAGAAGDAGADGGGGVGGKVAFTLVGGVLLLMMLAFFRLKARAGKSQSMRYEQHLKERREAREKALESGQDEQDAGPPLPADPAAALEELQRRQQGGPSV